LVGVIAPSDAVEEKDVLRGIAVLDEWGLKVKVGRHVYARIGDFSAGTAEERMEDIREMVFNDEVKVVWAAGGGYAATEILPALSREVIAKIKASPKWFIGYSDVCLILNALTSFRIVSLMGPNLGGFAEWDRKSQEYLREILFGEEVAGVGPEAGWKGELPGEARGRIVASNLETLILSFGTRFDPLLYGHGSVILFLEELETDKSQLQRHLDVVLGHRRARRISGVVMGRLTDIREVSYPEWGRKVTPEGLVIDRVKRFGVPLAFLADFGHSDWNYGWWQSLKYYLGNRRFYSLPNGVDAKLTVTSKNCSVEFLETPHFIKAGEVKSEDGSVSEGSLGGEQFRELNPKSGDSGQEGSS